MSAGSGRFRREGIQWRSLDGLRGSPALKALLEAEFPGPMPEAASLDRRRLMRLMAASLALGGLAGCDSKSAPKIVPYVRNPNGAPAGQPLFYSSAHVQDGIANGVLVKTVDGRPIKIEGNDRHPVSAGGTDVFAQASVLDLYDPDRSQTMARLGRPTSVQAVERALVERALALRQTGGRGLHILTGPTTSPSFAAQIRRLLAAMPEARWYMHGPINREAAYAGARLALGEPAETVCRFAEAELVVALGGDFLDMGPQQIGHAGGWMRARRAAEGAGRLAELHAAAAIPSLTSAKADHRLVVEQRRMAAVARGLLARLDGGGPGLDGEAAAWVERAATALEAHRGRSIVTAGLAQPAEVHALAHVINARLGNAGTTVGYIEPLLARATDPSTSLAGLAAAMAGGAVSTLLVLDSNPVYTAPGHLDFARLLERTEFTFHLGSHLDETATRCQWHMPLAHPLESWGDARALDGTVSLVQPVIMPLYAGRTPAEALALFAGGGPTDGLTLLRTYWQGQGGQTDQGGQTGQAGQPDPAFEARWEGMLVDGFVPGSASPPRPLRAGAAPPPTPAPAPGEGIEVLFRPDPTVWDGERANNGWLQELPKPLSKLVWTATVDLGPDLAASLGVASGEVVEVALGEGRVSGPAWVQPGQAGRTVTLYLGHGRAQAGLVGNGVGYDAYRLRPRGDGWSAAGARVSRTGESARLATTQELHAIPGDAFALVTTLRGDLAAEAKRGGEALYDPWPAQPHAWGMVIDLDSCIGCNACVTACQAENNIPVVGAEQVIVGRDMHWLRIDRYNAGAAADPDTRFQPVPCMHCEQAPCEVGCPVEATLHDHEGLNLQVYNRCIGTRTCSSYCPYKVRRFNYFDYTSGAAPSVQAQRNPDVTVRTRGVMEKCTYCVQRIAAVRVESDREDRPVRDGEMVTACQGACPTRAISFGDLKDPGSAVSAARRSERHYVLLEELNTRPRTTYLAGLVPDPASREVKS